MRSIIGLTFLAVALVGVAALPVNAQLVTTAVALDRLEGSLNGIIENAAAESNIVVYNAATEARLLLQQWRSENSALLQQAVSGANVVVANSLNSMSATVDQLENGLIDAREASETLLDSAQQLTETITLSSKPVLRRISPTYIVPGVSAPLRITVAGVNLDEIEHAELRFRGARFVPSSATQTSMLFSVPANLSRKAIPNSSEARGMLTWTYPHPSWWKRVVGQKVKVDHPFRLLNLPGQLAKITLSYEPKLHTRETQNRTGSYFHRRGGRYQSETCAVAPVRPFEGYKIAPESVHRTYDTGAYGRFEIQSLTPEGFYAKSCAKSRSRSGYKDTKLAWTEYRDVASLGPRETHPVQPLTWIQDLVVRVPQDAAAPQITIEVFDGRLFEVAGPGIHDFGFIREMPESGV